MNIFRCVKAVESYLGQLNKQFILPHDRIQQVTTLHNSILRASVLFPMLGLDSISLADLNQGKTSVNKQKAQECYQLLQQIAHQLHVLKDARGHLCSQLSSVEDSIIIMLANLGNLEENGQHPIQGEAHTLDKYHQNICFLMTQGLLPGFGQSSGECYGLAIDYGRHRIQRNREPFAFHAAAAEIQTDQRTKHPGKKIFLKRLGQCEYQPKLAKQAALLADYAQRQQGAHLVVKLKSETDQHLTYLELTPAGSWHYFEPNNGAYEFSRRADFEAFYRDLYSHQEHPWHSFQVSKLLRERPNTTWTGKWRSLLTGSNYQLGIWVERLSVGIFIAIILGTIAACVISPLIMLSTSVLPVAAVMSILIASLIVFETAAALGIYKIINHIVKAGFTGLLAIPRYIDYCSQRGKLDDEENNDEKNVKPEPARKNNIHTLQRDDKGKLNKPRNQRKIHTIFDDPYDCRFLKPAPKIYQEEPVANNSPFKFN